MDDNELKRMEQDTAELLTLLREARDEDNASFRTRPCKPYATKVRRSISPYWLVAASVLGFVLGMAMPRNASSTESELTTLLADTSYTTGRSIAAGDVNFALLVTR